MEPFNFNELPEVVRRLFEKVERIESLMEKLEPPKGDENQLLTIEEASNFLKVTVAALYTKVSRKEIPFSKPGRRLYFNKTDLNEWVKLGKRRTIDQLAQQIDMNTNRNRFRPTGRNMMAKPLIKLRDNDR